MLGAASCGIRRPHRRTYCVASRAVRRGASRLPALWQRVQELISEFGSTACKSLHRCRACREPFDAFKCPLSSKGGNRAEQAITTDRAPKPGGHFAQAIAVEATGRLVFIAGMVAQRPDGTIAGIGDIEAQTRQVCENVKAAVEAAGGATQPNVCRVDVYVRNMENLAPIHKVRREFFPSPPPASTLVEVSKFTHPDYLIEMSAIAVV